MRYVNIEQKSKEIQGIISRYTKESFVSFFADFIRHNNIRGTHGFSNKLKSKLKDSQYLIALRLSSNIEGKEKLYYSEENDLILQKVGDIILEIVNFYLSENYTPKYLDSNKIRNNKLIIHELTFKNYFQNGVLNYREQEVNSIVRLFEPYQEKIKKQLKIDLKTLIELCDYSEELYKIKAVKSHLFTQNENFSLLLSKLSSGIISNEEFNENLLQLPEEVIDSFHSFYESPHESLIFNKEDYYSKFDKNDVDIFCNTFSIGINEKINYLFYSQENPLDTKPIIHLGENKYLNIYQKQLPTALYNLLYKVLSKTEKEKTQLNHRRGKVVFENHTLNLFAKFFKKAKHLQVYHNYYLKGENAEKDILIIANNYAFVIECKTSRFREPRRSTEQAYKRISSDFKDCIQNGYDQCYTVENALLNRDEVKIIHNGETININSNKLQDIFSIVVTAERFGAIQSDLGLLLQRKNEEDVYPWSVYIDDLEVFLLTLKTMFNNPIRKFVDYLIHREYLNDRVITNDELDICALYLQNQSNFKKISEDDSIVFIDPVLQNYFDQLYFKRKFKIPKLSI